MSMKTSLVVVVCRNRIHDFSGPREFSILQVTPLTQLNVKSASQISVRNLLQKLDIAIMIFGPYHNTGFKILQLGAPVKTQKHMSVKSDLICYLNTSSVVYCHS